MYKLTEEQEKISKRNYKKAVNYFKSIGQWDDSQRMVLHHLDTSLRHGNVDEYIKWENVIPMTLSDHTRLHNLGRVQTEESNQKRSEALKGRVFSAESLKKRSESLKGRHHSEETKQRLREANLGKKLSEEQKKRIGEGVRGEKNGMYGKHQTAEARKMNSLAHIGVIPSDETRKKMSEARRGKHYYNNGVKSVFAYECPEGFVPGRLPRKAKES